jgi:glycosyltransferase involved in cell wall biosynthesis
VPVIDPVVVVPCYNETGRLSPEGFRRLADRARILFVDDGSTDRTRSVLDGICANLDGHASVLTLPRNCGKAEAVRQGLIAALAGGAPIVGFLDADLATPPEEMLRLLQQLDDASIEVALAARVGLLGTAIQRNAWRHYLGRVFATFASTILGVRVYDTQCGAKVFRASALLAAALAEPFNARWAFDVELIGRLLAGRGPLPGLEECRFVEMPLRRWSDVPDSKLTILGAPLLALELIRIYLALRRLRRAQLGLLAAPADRRSRIAGERGRRKRAAP